MNSRAKLYALWVAAVVAFVVGAGFAVKSVSDIEQYQIQCVKIADQMARLATKQEAIDRYEAALGLFEALGRKRPIPLATLLQGNTAKYRITPEQASAKNLDGWTLLRRKVVFADVKIEDAMSFVVAAAKGSMADGERCPPWSLVECDIVSSVRDAGKGEVVLVLEALAKDDRG